MLCARLLASRGQKRNSSMLRWTALPAPGVFWQMSITEWNRDVFAQEIQHLLIPLPLMK
jgi:hypothetical protein